MAVVPIIKVNNGETPKVLVTKCESVTKFDTETTEIITNLLDTALEPTNKAAGLSAPQIGVSKRVCVVRDFSYDPQDPDNEVVTNYVLVNPVIKQKSDRTSVGWEGCLSVPDKYGMVERAKKIKVSALNEKGQKIKLNAQSDFARVIQHELDHLDGILYTSKVVGKLLTEKELDVLLRERNIM